MTMLATNFMDIETGSWTRKSTASVANPALEKMFGLLHLYQATPETCRRAEEIEKLIAELRSMAVEDGEFINEFSVFKTRSVLQNLPEYICLPELINEPDGTIVMEWYENVQNVFVIAVKEGSTLEYASKFGLGNKKYGTVNFVDSLPRALAVELGQFLSVKNA